MPLNLKVMHRIASDVPRASLRQLRQCDSSDSRIQHQRVVRGDAAWSCGRLGLVRCNVSDRGRGRSAASDKLEDEYSWLPVDDACID